MQISGVTLIELLVATAILGALALEVAHLTVHVASNNAKGNLGPVRDQLVVHFRQSASSLNALRVSYAHLENAAFKQCACGGSGKCTTMSILPFTLYSNLGQKESGRYYDSNGNSCDPQVSACHVQVSARFLGVCPPAQLPSVNPVPQVTCAGPAEFIDIIYTVGPNPGVPSSGELFQAVTGHVITQVAAIAPGGVCP